MKRTILICGLLGGLLIALLRWSEYQFLVIDHSVEIYAALVAAVFAGLGSGWGSGLTRPRVGVGVEPVRLRLLSAVRLFADDKKRDDLGITRREMEILELVAQGHEQPRDRGEALREREHGEDALQPGVRQAGSAAKDRGRADGEEVGPAAVRQGIRDKGPGQGNSGARESRGVRGGSCERYDLFWRKPQNHPKA